MQEGAPVGFKPPSKAPLIVRYAYGGETRTQAEAGLRRSGKGF